MARPRALQHEQHRRLGRTQPLACRQAVDQRIVDPSESGEPQQEDHDVGVKIRDRGTGFGPRLAVSDRREYLDGLDWPRFPLTPLGVTIGAEVGGVDLGAELDDAAVSEVRRALLAHKVLVFRDQTIDAAQQLAFARRFGELEVHPFLPGSADEPEIVSLVKDQAVGGYENIWHSDVTWRERPAIGSVLRAVEVPERGGDTLWADMAMAHAGLDDETRARIENLVAVHDFTLSFGQALRGDKLHEARATYPPVEHPVVRTHPETGERLLYVNAIFTSHIVGLAEDESEALLGRPFAQADIPEYQIRLRWAPGTVAFWDNRATQHYASSDYWPQHRLMERATIIGERPE